MASGTSKGKMRLGRGLNSLISSSATEMDGESDTAEINANTPATAAESSIEKGKPIEIPLQNIVANPHQPRRTFTESSLHELAASIRVTGVIQPIIVRALDTGGKFELIAGERRWRAAKLAGLGTIPAILRQVDGFTQAQMALIENIQREDLNPIDRALGYRALIDALGLTQAELAGRLGEDRSTIANFVRLLELAEPVKTMLRDGVLSLGHAKLLAGVQDILEQERLALLAASQLLSVRNLERLIAQGNSSPPNRPVSGSPAHLLDLEKSISRQLGLRVQVRNVSKGRGRLVLHYTSLDQFDQLLHKLQVSVE